MLLLLVSKETFREEENFLRINEAQLLKVTGGCPLCLHSVVQKLRINDEETEGKFQREKSAVK